MKKLQLFKDGREIIASDGIMYVDGRLNLSNIRISVINRNKSYAKNFPHKIANQFAIYSGRNIGKLFNI